MASLYISKADDSVVKSPESEIPDQSITLNDVMQTGSDLEELKPQAGSTKLIVNTDIVSTGTISLFDNSFTGALSLGDITGNQKYSLPDASGIVCLDSNNCNYASDDAVVVSIGGINGVLGLGGGLSIQGNTLVSSTTIATSVNQQTGNVTIQGSSDRVTVTTNGSVVTVATIQDINTSSTPTFQSINLTTTGSQNGNTLCDQSNNCGFTTATNAFLQNGNSYGTTAVIGTNDANDLVFETAGNSRVIVSSLGTVDIQGHTAIGNSAGVDDMTTPNSAGLIMLAGGSGLASESVLVVEEVYSGDFQAVPIKNAGSFTLTIDPDVNGGVLMTGLTASVQIEATNSNNTGYLTGLSSSVDHFGTGDGDLLLGSISTAENFDAGEVYSAYGSMSLVGNYGLGDIYTAVGHAVSVSNAGLGTISGQAEGINIEVIQNSGVIDSVIGLNISSVSATTAAHGLSIGTVSAATGVGAAIASQPTVALLLGSESNYTTPNAGIMFGSSMDTNLYCGTANQLKTDDDLLVQTATDLVNGFRVILREPSTELVIFNYQAQQ